MGSLLQWSVSPSSAGAQPSVHISFWHTPPSPQSESSSQILASAKAKLLRVSAAKQIGKVARMCIGFSPPGDSIRLKQGTCHRVRRRRKAAQLRALGQEGG